MLISLSSRQKQLGQSLQGLSSDITDLKVLKTFQYVNLFRFYDPNYFFLPKSKSLSTLDVSHLKDACLILTKPYIFGLYGIL